MADEKKQKVAVLPFREFNGQPTVLGLFISENLIINLSSIGVEITERSAIDQYLGQNDFIDSETAKKVGRVAGADAVVIGSIVDLQSYIGLSCRLIDAQTGQISAVVQIKIFKDDNVRSFMAMRTTEPSSKALSSTPGEKHLKQQIENISYELKACKASGRLVECELLITNSREERVFTLLAEYCRLVVPDGDEYKATSVALGGSEEKTHYLEAKANLPTDVPVKARLIFAGIPPGLGYAVLVEIHRAQFRNVPLSRQ